MSSDNLGTLHRFLEALYRAYQRQGFADSADEELSIPLAIAIIRELGLNEATGPAPSHVAVVGPTQAGKSSVVNLLLNGDHAVASPLAGFTRALSGFALDLSPAQTASVERYLERAARPEAHTLIHVEGSAMAGAGPLVVWDTPDFDSVSSRGYRVDIADALALADLLVLVVSKEKYADLSVWRMVDMLSPLAKPLVVCLNKCSGDVAPVTASLQRRLDESRLDPATVALESLPYVSQDSALSQAGAALRERVAEGIRKQDRAARCAGLQRLMNERWQQWLAPVRAEIEQAEAWTQAVTEAEGGIVNVYRQRYLDDTRYYASFNQAVARLLELLEIPGLAGPLAKARQVLTWPVRKLFGMDDAKPGAGPDMEAMVLCEAAEHALTGLRRQVSDAAGAEHQGGRWAQAMMRCLAAQEDALRTGFAEQTTRYQAAFEPEIAAAAQSLYKELERSPAVLNSLRAARVSADAAGVVLAVKTGAVGVNEAVLTPAMLSLTSLLTESAVGKYVETVKEELKQRQFERVSELVGGAFGSELKSLVERLEGDRLFAIDARQLAAAERARDALER